MDSPIPADKDSPVGLRRRSSTLSDFSLSDARRSFRDGTQDILNPSAANINDPYSQDADDASSLFSSLPLAFALLPALFGVFFEGGSSLITDVMLLLLVSLFLRYTINQPWNWYHNAQQARSAQELRFEHVIDEDSEDDISFKRTSSVGTLDQVPEDDREADQKASAATAPACDSNAATTSSGTAPAAGRVNKTTKTTTAASGGVTRVQEAAINELYVHELLALVSCFVGPAIGAYLLHTIRAQLTRSEGLMSDFNITVFLLAAELKPISHALKLIQARTLYLQRIVQSVPVTPSMVAQLEEMQARLAQVEQRAEAAEAGTATLVSAAATQQQQRNGGAGGSSGSGNKQDAALMRELRNSIQPELDALNRAMRRYEKKATVLALQTESRLGIVDMRLNDAVSLAAAAAKQQRRNRLQWGVVPAFLVWVVGLVLAVLAMPYHVVMYAVTWPFRAVAGLCFRSSRRNNGKSDGSNGSGGNSYKLGRNGNHQSFGKGSRNSSGSEKDRHRDRVPSRVSRRYSP